MPEKRLERTRATLPPGYQFGDARPYPDRMLELLCLWQEQAMVGTIPGWPPHENAAERNERYRQQFEARLQSADQVADTERTDAE